MNFKKMAINFNYNYPQIAREAGFKLRQYKDGPLDWRLMGSLEIERILRDQSMEQIEGALLDHLSEAPLGSILETNILDSGIAKYFLLSQFSIQYLLFCRKFLDETIQELRESHAESQMDVARLKKSLSEANNEILQLHKKMTQMEALHEVVYPCHLCTKNFVSNEALNIHIGRKHAGVGGSDKRTETPPPVSVHKDRDNDLHLINTIKLELEIKQLKERLNVAEKDIRERSTGNSRRATPREHEELKVKVTTKNVGIQSNLIEVKEQDDAVECDESELKERKEQLTKLQEKIHNFEEWREKQSTNNEDSIAEINRKLADIVEVLESAKPSKEMPVENEASIQGKVSSSVEDLERLLTQKVAEIGKASAEKLEEVVYHMEMNYKEKLDELEREIKKKNVESEIKMVRNVETTKPVEEFYELDKRRVKRNASEKHEDTVIAVAGVKTKGNDDTYEIEDVNTSLGNLVKVKPKNVNLPEGPNLTNLTTISTESNHTFVKEDDIKEKDVAKIQFIAEQNDSTDISDSLSEESQSDDEEESEPKPDQNHLDSVKKKTKPKSSSDDEEKRKLKTPPKQFTRKDARKLVNRQLSPHGFDMKTKGISSTTMKKVSGELADKRNKLKKQYPNFYATRNKIKKFVDKLCSAKLPENAEAMLKTTEMQRQYAASSLDNDAEDSFERLEPETSTPLKTSTKDKDEAATFKQRLERILASPMRRPNEGHDFKTAADIHTTKPVPMPRKRVMFNTLSEDSEDDEVISNNRRQIDRRS